MKIVFNQTLPGITYKPTWQADWPENHFGSTGKMYQQLVVCDNSSSGNKATILVGSGEQTQFTPQKARQLGCSIAKSVGNKKNITLDLSSLPPAINVLEGFYLRYWSFTQLRSKTLDDHELHLETLNIVCDGATQTAFDQEIITWDAIHLTRQICTEPANICNSQYLEKIAQQIDGIKLKVLDEAQMKELGMNALLSVNYGSDNPAKMLVMEYLGGPQDQKPVVFVGKGVTFDCGGISIKPANDMHKMKKDMSGGAAVIGVMKSLGKSDIKANVIGIVPIVENVISSKAQRPGDVWKTANGQTVEVLNTDAEGRLILCDALWFAQEYYKPTHLIDMATLTGAILVALGSTYAGLYCNDEEMAQKLIDAGNQTDELLWRMPLHPDFDKDINSEIADIANIGQTAGQGGSNTAAAFLARFIEPGVKWAHIDIAGTAFTRRESFCAGPGSTGYGVRLALQWLKNEIR